MPDGTVHPIQVGLRMVEEFRTRVREGFEKKIIAGGVVSFATLILGKPQILKCKRHFAAYLCIEPYFNRDQNKEKP